MKQLGENGFMPPTWLTILWSQLILLTFSAETVTASPLSPKYTTLWSWTQGKHYVSEESFSQLAETRKTIKATFRMLCRQDILWKSDACSRKGKKPNSTVKSPGKHTINLSASSTFCIFYHQVLDISATSKTRLQKYCKVLNRPESVTHTHRPCPMALVIFSLSPFLLFCSLLSHPVTLCTHTLQASPWPNVRTEIMEIIARFF